MFLRCAVAVYVAMCAIELLAVLATQHLLHYFVLNGEKFPSFFFFFVSLRARSHQSTVANSVEIRHIVVFGYRLYAIYCCSRLFKWPDFLKAETAVSFSLHGKPVTTTRHHLTAEDSSL